VPPAAKRVKQEPGAAAGGVRPPQLPTHMHPAAMRTPSPGLPPGQQQQHMQPQPPLTAAAAGAAAQAALQQRIAAAGAGGPARLGFPPITKPTNDEEKLFLPKPRLQVGARLGLGGAGFLTCWVGP
jgi:hypothetical protein